MIKKKKIVRTFMSNSGEQTFDDMSTLKSSPKFPKIFIIKNFCFEFPRIIKGYAEADKITSKISQEF